MNEQTEMRAITAVRRRIISEAWPFAIVGFCVFILYPLLPNWLKRGVTAMLEQHPAPTALAIVLAYLIVVTSLLVAIDGRYRGVPSLRLERFALRPASFAFSLASVIEGVLAGALMAALIWRDWNQALIFLIDGALLALFQLAIVALARGTREGNLLPTGVSKETCAAMMMVTLGLPVAVYFAWLRFRFWL